MNTENHLSLNMTSGRAQLFLDKLKSLAFPEINVVGMKESLMKIQEASTGADEWMLLDDKPRSCSVKLKEAVYEAEDVLDEYQTEKLETQIATKLGHYMTSSSSSGSAYSRLDIIIEKLESLIRVLVTVLDMGMGSRVMKRAGKSEEEESQIIQQFPEKIELAEQVRGGEDETEKLGHSLKAKHPLVPKRAQIVKKIFQDLARPIKELLRTTSRRRGQPNKPFSKLTCARWLRSPIRDTVKALPEGMGSTVMKTAGKSEEEENQIIQSFPEKIELAEQVCGREAEKEEIVQLLINKNDRDLLAIPIVGEEGIGKTTLARLVFNDERVRTHFQLKLWIQMSDSSDLFTIIRQIIKGLTGSNCDILDEAGELRRRVHGALGGTLFLLVLDDVSDVSMVEMDSLINFLSCAGSGSRILITIPRLHVGSSESNTTVFSLGDLSEEDCWSLFSQRAFDNPIQESDPKLVTIGRNIVKMCEGFPLFVNMYAGLLYFQREESEWELVRGAMRKDNRDRHLRLCYSRLKPHLKQCFAFCSLFPKGYEIEKGTLIQLWMANGLVPTRDGMELEDVGHEIFTELVVKVILSRYSTPVC